FDRAYALNSVPQAWGVARALWLARALHVLMLGLLVALVITFGLGKVAFAGVALVALLLAYEHLLVSSTNLSRLNAAFFTMNGVISVIFFVFVATDLLLRRS
ncbi:MAG TPA: 4-hydroxybenzoate octaprenyltransferase, partial [Candidatus Angelobacter sp.]|nr:4-hydroxybenzoate octaprenyltransferase [Candidatus Angelobacter sp.]